MVSASIPFPNPSPQTGSFNNYIIGIIQGRVVNLRSRPSLDAKVVSKCKKSEPVIYMMKSKQKTQIGKLNEYWYKIRTQEGIVGWIYGHYLNILTHDKKGLDGLLRDLIEREFKDQLFQLPNIFYTLELESVHFRQKTYYLFHTHWKAQEVVSCETMIYLHIDDLMKIAEAPCNHQFLFFDFEKDGFAEIIALDKTKRSVFVYSEKLRKDIFTYSFYSEGSFDFLEDTYGSYIEIKEKSEGKPCDIVVHLQESPYHPLKSSVYHWNGSTFKKSSQ
jgi:hypothetical protein